MIFRRAARLTAPQKRFAVRHLPTENHLYHMLLYNSSLNITTIFFDVPENDPNVFYTVGGRSAVQKTGRGRFFLRRLFSRRGFFLTQMLPAEVLFVGVVEKFKNILLYTHRKFGKMNIVLSPAEVFRSRQWIDRDPLLPVFFFSGQTVPSSKTSRERRFGRIKGSPSLFGGLTNHRWKYGIYTTATAG